MKPGLSIITAFDRNRLIGQNNALPWHLPADLAFFKRTTLGKPVVMGRKTYESIGRPLPQRRNLVITRNQDFDAPGCDICTSIEQAISLVEQNSEIMLIGGASLYQQGMDLAENLYITEINAKFEGDAWFPEVSPEIWREVWREPHTADERNPYDYSFVKYSRVR